MINAHTFVSKEQMEATKKEQSDLKTDLALIKETMATKTEVAVIMTYLKCGTAILLAILGMVIKIAFFHG